LEIKIECTEVLKTSTRFSASVPKHVTYVHFVNLFCGFVLYATDSLFSFISVKYLTQESSFLNYVTCYTTHHHYNVWTYRTNVSSNALFTELAHYMLLEPKQLLEPGQCSRYSNLLQAGWCRDRIVVDGVIFRTHPDWPWRPLSSLHNGYWVSFPWVKWLGSGIEHPPLLGRG